MAIDSIDPAVGLDTKRDQGIDLALLRHVAVPVACVAALGPQCLGRLLAHFIQDVRQNDLCAFIDETFGTGETQPARGPCDDRHLSFKKHRSLSFTRSRIPYDRLFPIRRRSLQYSCLSAVRQASLVCR